MSAADAITTTVHVNLGQASHDIVIGENNLGSVVPLVGVKWTRGTIFIVTDPHVRRYANEVASGLKLVGRQTQIYEVPAGEQAKSIEHAKGLWERLLADGADRSAILVAVGGGVVGDLTGFVAATFTRGVPFVQVPTTLLAMVDSSVGGKVGINLPSAKNMVGAFHQPLGVVIDMRTLESLPDRDYRAGLAEVVKYGVIMDADFFAYLETNAAGLASRDFAVLHRVIARCCQLKAGVVERDERETTGFRAILNYGHTFAHALETVTGYGTLLHGEAVSIGMDRAARLAARLGRVDSEFVSRQRTLLQRIGLPVETPSVDRSSLIDAMRRDKKAEAGALRFILPTKIGHVELVKDVPTSEVEHVLSESIA